VDVVRFPDPRLKERCAPVGDGDVSALVDGLLETMAGFGRCVGIAAPQVGQLVRVCVVDCSVNPKVTDHHGRLVLIDPEIVDRSEETEVGREGCLSIPDLTANVRRATEIVVEAGAPEGAPGSGEADAFEARCLLHGIDPLGGGLFLDLVDPPANDRFRRQGY